MPSTFSWVDFEEKDRQKMLEVIKMFQETDTRDELGIGTIRDTFSEMLFPGTNTIQTRVKYKLFIPWIYLRHEKKKTPSSNIATKVRNDEVSLINALLRSEDTRGVIGGTSGEKLQRMPTSVYWYGLGRWGIRQFNGTMEELHRYMNHYYLAKKNVVKDDDNEPAGGMVRDNWHPGLPSIPKGFPYQASFQLSKEEAEYLLDRIVHNCNNTLMAWLVSNGNMAEADYIWEHPDYGNFPEQLRTQVFHARNFSVAINGAALLYNLMLAEKSNNESRKDEYKEKLAEWAINMNDINLADWDRNEFWDIVESAGRIPALTKQFVNSWLDRACGKEVRDGVAENEEARMLIALRERRLKRNRARLENQRALELWSGAAGTSMLSYRWEIARVMISDIILGLQEGLNA